MAAPVFVQASTGATDAGGAWTATGAAGTSGNIVILQVLQDGTTASTVALTSATNIENLAGTDNAWTSIGSFTGGGLIQHIWIGRLINTSAPTATGSNGTSEDLYWRFMEFANVNTGTTLAEVIEQNGTTTPSTSSGTSGTIADAGVTTTGPDRLPLQFVAVNDDNAFACFTGAYWSWLYDPSGNAQPHYAESSGTDGAIAMWHGVVGYCSRQGTVGGAIQNLYGGSGTGEQIAQSFTPDASGVATSVSVQIYKAGTPTDNLIFEIQSDSSNSPSGTVVGSSGSIAGSGIDTSGNRWFNAGPLGASLTSGTRYWLVIRRDGSRDTSNYYACLAGSTQDPDETASIRGSGTWTNHVLGYDFPIQVFIGSGGTIDGGTATNPDAGDGWGVVGFALIGTTVVTPAVRTISSGAIMHATTAVA